VIYASDESAAAITGAYTGIIRSCIAHSA